LADRFARRLLFQIFAGLAGGLAIVLSNLPATHLAVAAGAVSLFMVFASARMVPAQALLLGVPVPRLRGSFLSLNTAVQHAGTTTAPLIAGVLLTRTEDGHLDGFPIVGVVTAAMAAVSLVLVGRVRPVASPSPVVAEPRHHTPDADPEPKPAAV
jgi:predicted MFS family arabinose efflux permease